MTRLRRIFYIICFSVIFIGVLTLGFYLYRLFYRSMIATDQPSLTLNIDKFSSASSFVHLLSSRHLIESPRLFLLLIRAQGLSEQLKAGVYQLRPGETAPQFLVRVADGDVLMASFCLVDGTTQAQVSAALKKAPYLIYNPIDWLIVAGNYLSAEGLLLADTYYYKAGSQSKGLLQLAHNNLEAYLERSWQKRSFGLPYKTSYEMLIAASILEKEAADPREKRLISGVIVNRLRKNMPLQMDPTVIYAMGSQYEGKLTRDNLHIDSPYNSYRYRGLPPTPITMVGRDAIDAAAHPEFSDYLYFVAVGDGSHHFSVTYEQQKKAVARYRKK
jgi:UPF0755 protein